MFCLFSCFGKLNAGFRSTLNWHFCTCSAFTGWPEIQAGDEVIQVNHRDMAADSMNLLTANGCVFCSWNPLKASVFVEGWLCAAQPFSLAQAMWPPLDLSCPAARARNAPGKRLSSSVCFVQKGFFGFFWDIDKSTSEFRMFVKFVAQLQKLPRFTDLLDKAMHEEGVLQSLAAKDDLMVEHLRVRSSFNDFQCTMRFQIWEAHTNVQSSWIYLLGCGFWLIVFGQFQ